MREAHLAIISAMIFTQASRKTVHLNQIVCAFYPLKLDRWDRFIANQRLRREKLAKRNILNFYRVSHFIENVIEDSLIED